MIVLHHALKDLAESDIAKIHFKCLNDFQLYIENMVERVMVKFGEYKPSKTVYLFTYDLPDESESEIIITSKIYMIADFLEQSTFWGLDVLETFYLQEFDSFEEAYKVALSMKETSPLCYNK